VDWSDVQDDNNAESGNAESSNAESSSSRRRRNAITKTFEFADFATAWTFMSEIAQVAEEMNHHPEWFNVYSRVIVTLTTHDCNGVSEKVRFTFRYMCCYFLPYALRA